MSNPKNIGIIVALAFFNFETFQRASPHNGHEITSKR